MPGRERERLHSPDPVRLVTTKDGTFPGWEDSPPLTAHLPFLPKGLWSGSLQLFPGLVSHSVRPVCDSLMCAHTGSTEGNLQPTATVS